MSTASLQIENRKNTGTDPQTVAQVPEDGTSKAIKDLALDPKPSTLPKILATNMTNNQFGYVITVKSDKGKTYTLNQGAPVSVIDGDTAVDVAHWTVSAKKA